MKSRKPKDAAPHVAWTKPPERSTTRQCADAAQPAVASSAPSTLAPSSSSGPPPHKEVPNSASGSLRYAQQLVEKPPTSVQLAGKAVIAREPDAVASAA